MKNVISANATKAWYADVVSETANINEDSIDPSRWTDTGPQSKAIGTRKTL